GEDVGWRSGDLALDFDFLGHDLILTAFRGGWVRYDNGAQVSNDGRMRRLLVLFGVAAAVGLGAPAHADPGVDASFLDALTKAGITFSNGPSAISAGKTACAMMSHGQPELDVVQHVSEQNPGISTTSAAKFTAIAASAYCPQYLQRASESTEPPPPSGPRE
ncbi:DUF732 domain-containing protein, partial [Mycobacterium sp.]|uniref:DUF732 domain-containing protein n=1 Tax=Mycobacterium sp. TaxID=1785 RepID=UPI003C7704CB